MEFRKEIDGLRTVAVIPVILFHAGFAVFSGGFIGVDIFFVISGYLITATIMADLQAGRFSLTGFYERRARRILPALLLVTACCIPFAWLWMMPEEFRAFSDSLIAVSLSGANFLFWYRSGYFAPEASEIPLLHTWSLGVEEQYYMLFPLLMMLVWKRRPGRLLAIVAALALASLVYSQWASFAAPSANFYLLPSRAFELLAGSICSLLQARRMPRGSDPLSLLGFAMVLVSLFYFGEETPMPSVLTLFPVVGTALVLLFARQGTRVAALLSTRPFTLVGKISYSAYLWHQPLFAFARMRSIDLPSPITMGTLAVVSLVLGYVSWRFVEQPFRRREARLLPTLRGLTVSASVLFAAFIIFGVYGHNSWGIPGRLPVAVTNFMEVSGWSKKCLLARHSDVAALPNNDCIFNAAHPLKYAIFGDSVASSLAPSLAKRLDGMDISLEQITRSSCPPVAGVSLEGAGAEDCLAFTKAAIDYLVKSDIKTVIMASSWQVFADRVQDEVGEEIVDLSAGQEKVTRAFDKTVHDLASTGIRVVILYPHPLGDVEVADRVARLMLKGVAEPVITIPMDEFQRDTASFHPYLDSPKDGNIIRVDPAEMFCGKVERDRCDLARGGKAFISDKFHFTPAGAEIVVEQILTALH